jgi:DNA-binding response OmpR family regulator
MQLVEDDELTCSLMRSIFAGTGLEIVEAHTLAEAFDLVDSRPDYMILDCTLPASRSWSGSEQPGCRPALPL